MYGRAPEGTLSLSLVSPTLHYTGSCHNLEVLNKKVNSGLQIWDPPSSGSFLTGCPIVTRTRDQVVAASSPQAIGVDASDRGSNVRCAVDNVADSTIQNAVLEPTITYHLIKEWVGSERKLHRSAGAN